MVVVNFLQQLNPGKVKCIAKWREGGYGGVGWLDGMVESGRAINLGGNGYPFRYTAIAAFIIPNIINIHPRALEIWTNEELATDLSESRFSSVTNFCALRDCRFSEWLLIEAWCVFR
jgi:hypothetical protein